MQADLLGGSILLSFDTLPENVENIRAGRLRAYAVTAPRARAQRAGRADHGRGRAARPAGGELARPLGPAGLPEAIVRKLSKETDAVVRSAAFQERMATVGIVPRTMTPEAFTAFATREVEVMGGAVRRMGIRNE